MSGTRSLKLLLLFVVFCAGLALATSTAGISALATRTQQKLNPPTALWNAYPLRQAHSSTNNKPISTGTSKVSTTSPMRTRTGSTESRPTVHGNRIANRPTSGTGGFPTVFVMAGVMGALLASTFLLVSHAAPARAGGYRRNGGPNKTKPPSRTGRTGRPSARRKLSRAKHPPTARPAEVRHLSHAKPPTTQPYTPKHPPTGLVKPAAPRTKPVSPPESPSAEQPSRTTSASPPPPQRRKVAGDQFCEIKFWRGYVKCRLYVQLEGSPGVFVESSPFRLRDPMVADDRAQTVLADLLADLERAGWSVVETGPVWYRRRLQRSTPTP
jgi:hypothetical protein